MLNIIFNFLVIYTCIVTIVLTPCYANQENRNQPKKVEEIKAASSNTDIQKIWVNFLKALQSGNSINVKNISTTKGYESLLTLKRPAETEEQFLKRIGKDWEKSLLEWHTITENECIGSLGPSMKPSVIHFIKESGNWKFDQFYYGR